MKEALQLAMDGMKARKGGPFGAVIVRQGEVIGRGQNQVTSTNDPTAHAEIVAIRDATAQSGSFQLNGCDIYTSCEPCPMCLGAIYWARLDRIYYAATREDAAVIGFDDRAIYDEYLKPVSERSLPMSQFLRDEALDVFEIWANLNSKICY
ncbi:MAG: nucleoside deaminase [SAR324 cluster bacterium]|nr:nucleoside deaminase [SAR324 cluster bacterium]